MTKEYYIIEGEFYFGDDVKSVATLLGSCVAIVVWHPEIKVGGMCHIVLPDQGIKNDSNKYANCAVTNFIRCIKKINTQPQDYRTCIYGGGAMFVNRNKSISNIGKRNVEAVKKMLFNTNFRIYGEDTGGQFYRKIRLNLITGDINLKAINIKEGNKAILHG